MAELSEAIVSAPVVLLTGAGASAPLGKATTEGFMEHVAGLLSQDLAGVFQRIRSKCKPSEGVEVVDIEVVLDHLAGCIESSNTLEADPHFGGLLFRTDPPGGQVHELVRTYTRLRDVLLDEVVRHYGEVRQAAAAKLYRPILLEMPQKLKAWTIPVFTLNYDLAIEAAAEGLAIRLVDGINRRGVVENVWSAAQFASFRGYRSTTVVLFKLHGSVSWCRDERGAIRQVVGLHRDPRPFKHALLYPSLRSKDLHGEPWSTGYRYLRACLGRAKVALIIGTSLRDAEVVEALNSALAENPGLTLVFVSPLCDNEALARRLGIKPSRVVAMAARFGEPTVHPDPARIARLLVDGDMRFAGRTIRYPGHRPVSKGAPASADPTSPTSGSP